MKSFHRYVFSDILRVDRVPLVFKPEIAENQLLIILLNKTKGEEVCNIIFANKLRTRFIPVIGFESKAA